MMLDLNDNIIKNTRALIFKNENGRRLFLLTQEVGANYTLPGGCKDLEDPNLLAALRRELKEELNLDERDYVVTPTNFKKTYKNLYSDPAQERFGKDTTVFLFIVECKNETNLKSGQDIMGFAWFNEDAAYKALNYQENKEMLELGLSIL